MGPLSRWRGGLGDLSNPLVMLCAGPYISEVAVGF